MHCQFSGFTPSFRFRLQIQKIAVILCPYLKGRDLAFFNVFFFISLYKPLRSDECFWFMTLYTFLGIYKHYIRNTVLWTWLGNPECSVRSSPRFIYKIIAAIRTSSFVFEKLSYFSRNFTFCYSNCLSSLHSEWFEVTCIEWFLIRLFVMLFLEATQNSNRRFLEPAFL